MPLFVPPGVLQPVKAWATSGRPRAGSDRREQPLAVTGAVTLGAGADDDFVLRIALLEFVNQAIDIVAEKGDAPGDDFRPPVGRLRPRVLDRRPGEDHDEQAEE